MFAGVAGILLAACIWVPGSAQATIYWANSGNGPGGTIGSAANDGSSVFQSFITGADYPRGVAANSTHVYWANAWPSPNTIGRSDLDGGSAQQSFITGPDVLGVTGMALDSQFLYFVNRERFIGRARLNGSDVDPDWIDTTEDPAIVDVIDVAVDNGHVYWAAYGATDGDGGIGRADINGSNVQPDHVPNLYRPSSVAVDSTHIFWAENQLNKVGRANLAGGGVESNFISLSAPQPWGIDVGDQEILVSRFASSGAGTPGAISRANLDGSGLDDDFISGANFPQGVDLTEPASGFSPASRDFGSLTSGGATGVTESFTLTSSGDAPLTVSPGGITIAETDGANFGLVGGSCLALSVSLANGQSCTIDVRFSPVTAGSKSATLSVATNGGTRTASLTGTGVAPPAPTPPEPVPSFSGLAFSPASKSARAPRRGKRYVTLKLRLANRGDAAGTATVSLRSGSRHVKVPSRVSVKVGAGSTASKSFRASVYSRARGTVRVTARLPGGDTAQLRLRVRR